MCYVYCMWCDVCLWCVMYGEGVVCVVCCVEMVCDVCV